METNECDAHNPPWLVPLLEAPFYDHCEIHKTKVLTYFCNNCMGKAFCDNCLKDNDEHKGHHILRIFKSSYEPAVRINALLGSLDVSKIHTFMINSYSILYLNSRKHKEHGSRDVVHKCEICGWDVKSAQDRFCSIGCKVKGKMSLSVPPCNCQDLYTRNGASSSNTSSTNQALHSFRKRSRKAIPCRSPFF